MELLKEMKRAHEENIERACNYLNIQKAEIVNFSSPIKGSQVNIIYEDTRKTVLLKKQPASQYGKIIKLNSAFPITEKAHWAELEKKLITEYDNKIRPAFDHFNNLHFSVFPLAPMPLIIKLGELFGDKTNVDIFQKTREPDTWSWQSEELTNSFLFVRSTLGP